MKETDLIDFLKKQGYVIIVKDIRGGLTVTLPEIKTKFVTKESKTTTFLIKRGKNSRILIDDPKKTIKIPEYAIRLYLSSVILQTCMDLGYNFDFLIVKDKLDREIGIGIESVEKIIRNPKDTEKEFALIDIFNKCSKIGTFETFAIQVKEAGIEEGFNTIKSLFTGETNG